MHQTTCSTSSSSTNNSSSTSTGGCNYLCRGGPLKQVGGFFLTFPFNEATRRSCFPSLDLRAVVSEIKRELRKCVSDVRVGRQSSAFNRDIPLLWGPPKPPLPMKSAVSGSNNGSSGTGANGGGISGGSNNAGAIGAAPSNANHAGFGGGGILSNRG